MAQVFECDLCREISQYNFETNKKYCGKCNTILYDIEIEAYKKVRKELASKYEHTVMNQANVLRLIKWMYDDHLDSFTEYFGTQGRDLLIKALEK
jgi:hypothetical protein